jgi:hypothetical protein
LFASTESSSTVLFHRHAKVISKLSKALQVVLDEPLLIAISTSFSEAIKTVLQVSSFVQRNPSVNSLFMHQRRHLKRANPTLSMKDEKGRGWRKVEEQRLNI